MQFDGQQLAAFAAVIEFGSFDAAAERLHVTPSAVSQRIKALEQRVGQVLVLREKPCRATDCGCAAAAAGRPDGDVGVRGAGRDGRWFGGSGPGSRSRSMPTRCRRGSPLCSGELPDVLFDVRIEDQDHSARLLREGAVMGAVTTERTPVPGCRVQPLGVMRYVPVAARPMPSAICAMVSPPRRSRSAPSLAWNRDDALQDMLVRKAFRRDIARPVHYVPTAEGFAAAVRAGLGWGMFPHSLAAPNLDDGSFVRISDVCLDVPLFWQCWKLDSPLVKAITNAVESAAASLRRHRN